MKKNIGNIDKLLRLIAILTISLLIYTDVIKGYLSMALLAFAVVLLFTSFFRYSPLYQLFGFTTLKDSDRVR